MEKKLVYLAIVIFLASAVSAYPSGVYKVNSLRPPIEIVYDQQVKLLNMTLEQTEGSIINLDGPQLGIWSNSFNYTPVFNLVNNKTYALTVTAEDLKGNTKTERWEFVIVLLAVQLKVIEPQFGYTSKETYNLVIETNREVKNCRYDEMDEIPYSIMTHDLIKIGSNRLKLANLVGSQTLYVMCVDAFDEVDSYSTRLDLVYDPVPPAITANYAKPILIIEITNDELQTTLNVETNKPTVCKYSETQVNDYNSMNPDITTDLHDGFFEQNDESNAETYSTAHKRLLGNFQESLANKAHTYYVICRSLAGLSSDVKQISFSVDLTYPLQITVKSPLATTNNTNVLLAVETNKRSTCSYGLQQPANRFSTTDRYYHQATTAIFEEGRHVYNVHCNYSRTQGAQTTIAFYTDFSPPSIKEIKTNNYICPDSRGLYTISAELKAEDNISGVDYYKYSIASAYFGEIINWENSNGSVKAKNLNLTYTTVHLVVRAVDKAGNTGEEKLSSDISVLDKEATECVTAARCDINEEKDDEETDVDCGGTECPKCGLGKSCETSSDCLSWKCENKHCVASNITSDQCSDYALSNGETDVDCGGVCSPCANGKKCSKGGDCQSSYCRLGICEAANCYDGIDNSYETDIDCGGGVCPGCEIGKKCSSNSDCISKRCEYDSFSGISICMGASCDDKVQDGQESGVDCGGDVCKGCAVDQACNKASDCLSMYCSNTGYCKEPPVKDSDNDGMPDDWENKYGLNPNDPTDAGKDKDNDGLKNADEYSNGTDPTNPDTDGDGTSDGDEVKGGFDPKNPASHPKSSRLTIIIIILILLVLGIIGFFVGYPRYKKYQESKKPRAQGQFAPARPVSGAGGASEELLRRRKEAHERFIKKMDSKEEQRKRLFEEFGPAAKPAKPLEKKEVRPVSEEVKKPVKEWMALSELRSIVKSKSAFDKLEKISKGKNLSKQEVFDKLEELSTKSPKKSKKVSSKDSFEKLDKISKKPKK